MTPRPTLERAGSWVGAALLLLLLASPAWAEGETGSQRDTHEPRRGTAFPARELVMGSGFVQNAGQWDTAARFVGHGPGMVVRAEPGAVVLELRGDRWGEGTLVRLVFEGAREDARIDGEEPVAGARHFYLGNDPQKWRTDVPAFARVHYRELYPGIDVVLQLTAMGLEYDVLLAPGAELERFLVRCEGTAGTRPLPAAGGLELLAVSGILTQLPGPTWQVRPDGGEIPRTSRIVPLGEDRFALEVSGRDPSLATVIDPTVVWSTYLGGGNYSQSPGDIAYGVHVHEQSGDVFVVGDTEGANFPTTPGAFVQNPGVGADIFLTRLRAADGALVYSSVLGGTHHGESALAVTTDADERPTVVGFTLSTDFPTTPGALKTQNTSVQSAGFVFRLSAQGDELQYSTYLQGDHPFSNSRPYAVEVLGDGRAIVAGTTNDLTMPFPPGGAGTVVGARAGFVAQLAVDGSHVEWGTFVGGSLHDDLFAMRRGGDGTITVGGSTVSSADFPTTPGVLQPVWIGNSTNSRRAFVTRISPDGTTFLWSTFFGGSGSNRRDEVYALDLLPSGDVVIGGWTSSFDSFPVTAGAFQTEHQGGEYDGFIARLDSEGAELLFSTYIGTAAGIDRVVGLALDPSGVVSFASQIGIGFPTTPGAWQTRTSGGDMLVGRLHPSGQKLLYGTYFGGPGGDWVYALDMAPAGRVTLAGNTFSNAYPTTPGAAQEQYAGGQTDAFVTTLDLYLAGVEPLGTSTPSCRGPLQLNATKAPVAGESEFGLWCSGAPPHGQGFLLLGTPLAQPLGTLGADLWIDRTQRLAILPFAADADGYAELLLPLPAHLSGLGFAAQALFPATPDCPAPTPLSASNALLVQVP